MKFYQSVHYDIENEIQKHHVNMIFLHFWWFLWPILELDFKSLQLVIIQNTIKIFFKFYFYFFLFYHATIVRQLKYENCLNRLKFSQRLNLRSFTWDSFGHSYRAKSKGTRQEFIRFYKSERLNIFSIIQTYNSIFRRCSIIQTSLVWI